MRKRPDKTLSRNDCNVDPSNGNAPQTSTYNTTPNDCNNAKGDYTLKTRLWHDRRHVTPLL